MNKMYEVINELSRQVEKRYGEGLFLPSSNWIPDKISEFKTNPELVNWFGLGFSDLPAYEILSPDKVVDAQIRIREDHQDLTDNEGNPLCWGDIVPAANGLQYCESVSVWPDDWIPIATSREGRSVIFVDLMPAKGGTVGQVVHAAEMTLGVVGKSITDWLVRISNAVENGLFHDDVFFVMESEIRNK